MISAGIMREEQKKPQQQDMCAHFTTSWYDVRLLFPSTPRKQLHHHPIDQCLERFVSFYTSKQLKTSLARMTASAAAPNIGTMWDAFAVSMLT